VRKITIYAGRLKMTQLFELPPKDELYGRIDRFQDALRAQAVDYAILIQNVDLFYLTGTLQRGFLVVPADGAPLFLVQKDWDRAHAESPLPMERVTSLKKLPGFLTEMGLNTKKRVGLEFDVLPLALFQRIHDVMGERTFVDISGDILRVRAKKSSFELEQIRKSGQIIEHVFSTVPLHCREEMSEVEVNGQLQGEGRRKGHQGLLRMRGLNQEMPNLYVLAGESATVPSCGDVPLSGPGVTPAVPQGASWSKIARNVPIIVDYGGGYNGYITDETRTFVLGTLNEKFERAYGVAREVIEVFEAHAREGVDAGALYARCLAVVRQSGLEDHFMGYCDNRVKFIGHGLGLEINELPIIASRRKEILEEGMVFAFEPKFVFPGQGAVGVEVDYIVRKGGVERTTTFPIDIQYI